MIIFKLFLVFFEIGAFTFGGGYAMLPLIKEAVLKYGWIDIQDLVNFIAVSESTPGPFAVNLATYIGVRAGGIPGAFMATLGVVLPSFVIILFVARQFDRFQKNKYVKGVMSGLKPAVVGLITSALISVGGEVFFPDGYSVDDIDFPLFFSSIAIFVLIVLLHRKKIHPILLICLAAVLGIISGYVREGMI